MYSKTQIITPIAIKHVIKAIFVVVCCTIFADVALHPMRGLRMDNFPALLRPDLDYLHLFAWIWLGTASLQSLILSIKGKISASWAVLTFGSVTAALAVMLLTALWYRSDIWRTDLKGVLFVCLPTIALTYFGWKAAIRGAWKQIVAFSIGSLMLMFMLGASINYGEFLYCQRNHLDGLVYVDSDSTETTPQSSVKNAHRQPEHQTGNQQRGKSNR